MSYITRFAPSPTGPLHLGHAYSAITAHDRARAAGGAFLLRIEDIDTTRSHPTWEQGIYDDLEWLGLTWDAEPIRQTDRLQVYQDALDRLWHLENLLYPCICSRKTIAEAIRAAQRGDWPVGPDGPVYPGTCREKTRRDGPRPTGVALRLDMRSGLRRETYEFRETGPNGGAVTVSAAEAAAQIGDVVLSRKDFVGSYHLSVILDDAAQGVTEVVRGADLFEATKIHVVLQDILGLPTPLYHHHRLILDEAGKRLAKRDDARAIASYRAQGASPQDVRRMVGL